MPAIRRRALLAAAALSAPALAQEGFPNRPLRLVVGFTPGGATDISARTMAPKMSEALAVERAKWGPIVRERGITID